MSTALSDLHSGVMADTRVLFVNTRDGLGADVAVHLLIARHLREHGVHVTFSVNRQAAGAATMLAQLRAANVGVACQPLGRPVADSRGLRRALALLGNTAALAGFWQLARYVHERRVDVLHATDRPRDALTCVLLGQLTGRPTVIHMHSNYGPGMSRLSRWAFAHCSCVLGVSEFTRRSMAEAGVPAERLAAVLNAVDANLFDPDRTTSGLARRRWNVPADAPLLGLIGRFIPYKGHEDLLEALAARQALARAHLLVVGDDSGTSRAYADGLRARVQTLGLSDRVHFTGFQDVLPIYADLDLLVVPSWDEPFGLVVVEAMAMRVPVVAYRAGGIPEIVRSGMDGLLVPPRALDALADALVRLIQQPELRARLGAAGRQRVLSHFSPTRQAAEIAALYQRLVAGRKGASGNVAIVSR